MRNHKVVRHPLSRPDGDFEVLVLDNGDSRLNPACAAVFGKPVDDCLVRIHSRCLYGDIFGADTCDCREQLDRSIKLIKEERAGVVVYLDQEGRGAGLVAKAMGYRISQNEGLDTFASYRHLGLPLDSRSYADAAALLVELGLHSVRLLTNNPEKVQALADAGIEVKRETLLADIRSEFALDYLLAKEEHGHTFTEAAVECTQFQVCGSQPTGSA